MKIYADYHTHTVYSHGKGTIRDNVEVAIKKGLKEIGITDHGPSHMGFGVSKENLKKMRKEIDQLNKEYPNINILLGVEANVIGYDGTIDVDEEIIKFLDILLVGFHFGARPKSISDAYKFYILNNISKISKIAAEKARNLNTQALINAMDRYDIDLITHPGAKVDVNVKKLAKAAAKKGTALEINASHGQLTVEYIKIAMEEDVDFIISSDAHKPEDVGNVSAGIERAEKAGLPSNRIKNTID